MEKIRPSNLSELSELQQSIADELKANPGMQSTLIGVQKRILSVKDAINGAIADINRLMAESGGEAYPSAACVSISFQMSENGLYSYQCQTYDLVHDNDDEEQLTGLGLAVKERIRAQGITHTVFLYSELPF